MPLEIILEINAELRPTELLDLSRTSRTLCNFPHEPEISACLENRHNVPSCPDDLSSEPAYASLAFEVYCHNSSRNNLERCIRPMSIASMQKVS
ncbi:hypothetical protein BDY19DRAFT_169393 [Irpex rosettiformis]|uniref:Uncharacterized protein n=1 Tax=Irpex rosettiformis TaxID=378272 RepID=A0ACB8U2F0_9APHY|nr:hypothetical protein BDY19DRAFT_169393 [Irpex rosettiformis]